MRLEREAKARPGVVPDAVIVAGDNAKGVRTGRKAGVVGGAAIAGVDPVLVETLESVAETCARRCKQTQSRIMEFPLPMSGTHLGARSQE